MLILNRGSYQCSYRKCLTVSCADLFHQYITQSGSSLCFWAYTDIEEYKQYAVALAEYLNCPTNNSQILIDCLRDVNVDSIINSFDIFPGLTKQIRTWVPTAEPEHEGAFLTTSPIKSILQKKMRDYPWLTGNVADEGLVFTGR